MCLFSSFMWMGSSLKNPQILSNDHWIFLILILCLTINERALIVPMTLGAVNIDLCYIHCLTHPSCVLLSTVFWLTLPTTKQSLGHIQCFARLVCIDNVLLMLWWKSAKDTLWECIFCFMVLDTSLTVTWAVQKPEENVKVTYRSWQYSTCH